MGKYDRQKSNLIIEKANFNDYGQIMEVWESSVKATHDFLKQEDFEFYKKVIPTNYLPNLDVYILRSVEKTVGFVGISEKNIEMLFISGEQRGRGYGKILLEYAIDNFNANTIEVNEQNTQAIAFYKKLGFKMISRSEKDSENKGYPVLILERNKRENR